MLLTRPPLYLPRRAFSLDLHVLGTPPAFILSQDQTLHHKNFRNCSQKQAGANFYFLVYFKDLLNSNFVFSVASSSRQAGYIIPVPLQVSTFFKHFFKYIFGIRQNKQKKPFLKHLYDFLIHDIINLYIRIQTCLLTN